MTVMDLWLPILAAAIAVWLLSSVVWMVLPHHRTDYKPLPNEHLARDVLADVPAGLFAVPHDPEMALMKTPEGKAKYEEGPVAIMTFLPKGLPSMAKSLISWLVFCVGVGSLIALILVNTLDASAARGQVFRMVVVIAWLAYGAATVQRSVWFGEPWLVTFKHLADAALYALATAAAFALLW